MHSLLMRRRNFLSERKNRGHRITVGFTGIADFRSLIGQKYVAGIMQAVADYDINFINMAGAIKYSLCDDMDFIRHYLKSFRFMKAPLLDGMVIWASSLCSYMDDAAVVRTFSALQPLPMVDIGYLSVNGVPSIRIDNEDAFRLLMDHLITVHKFTRFGFIGTSVSRPHRTRLGYYRRELSLHNIKEIPGSTFLCPSMDVHDIASAADALCRTFDLHQHKDLEAIITTSDIIAATLEEELAIHGLTVPGDIAVTGFNNQYSGITALTPLTTIDPEYFRRGYTAVELLIDRIMEPAKEYPVYFVPTSLVVRESCGCFEKNIVDAGSTIIQGSGNNLPSDNASETDIQEYLLRNISEIFMRQNTDAKKKLVRAVFSDIYEADAASELLVWFRNLLLHSDRYDIRTSEVIQQQITRLRSLILPLVRGDEKRTCHIENILHQLRVMVSVNNDYTVLAQQENSYVLNSIIDTAVNFMSVTSGGELCDVLKYQLGKMKIPGIMLALGDHAASDLGALTLDFVYPEPEQYLKKMLPLRIPSDSCIPKLFFPKERSYCMMFEILHHADQYFGYAMMEMGQDNVSLYDSVRVMLCHSLNVLYMQTRSPGGRNPLLEGNASGDILTHFIPGNTGVWMESTGAKKIIDYLQSHLDEMTSLEKMSQELGMSKSNLVRQTKHLTGYTVQSLHEKMKIEQAKKLLLIGTMKYSEIACRLGFQNQNYFSAVFKKCTGLSPHNWVLYGKH